MHIDKYERNWIRLAGGMLVVFLLALTASAFFPGIQLPGIADHATPVAAAGGEFDVNRGWVRELAPRRYEADLRARCWALESPAFRFRAGSSVTFDIHSDVIISGYRSQSTTVSLLVFPDVTAMATYTFE